MLKLLLIWMTAAVIITLVVLALYKLSDLKSNSMLAKFVCRYPLVLPFVSISLILLAVLYGYETQSSDSVLSKALLVSAAIVAVFEAIGFFPYWFFVEHNRKYLKDGDNGFKDPSVCTNSYNKSESG